MRKERDSVSARLKLYIRLTITEGTGVSWKKSAHRLRTTVYFAELFDEPGCKGAFEMRHSCPYLFPLVCIFELCTQISCPLAYVVRISLKSSETSEPTNNGAWNKRCAHCRIPVFLWLLEGWLLSRGGTSCSPCSCLHQNTPRLGRQSTWRGQRQNNTQGRISLRIHINTVVSHGCLLCALHWSIIIHKLTWEKRLSPLLVWVWYGMEWYGIVWYGME